MTTTRLPFFSEHVTGSVGARLFMLAYRLTQVVHMASVVSADRDQDKKVKLLKSKNKISSRRSPKDIMLLVSRVNGLEKDLDWMISYTR